MEKENDESIISWGNTEESETPANSSLDIKQEEEEPSQDGDQSEDETDTSEDVEDESEDNSLEEKNIPFHKHPRWKQREDAHKKDMEQLKSEIDDLKQSKQPPVKTAPQEFTELFGDNLPDGTYEKFEAVIDKVIKEDRQKVSKLNNRENEKRSEESRLYEDNLNAVATENKVNKNAFRKFFVSNPILTADGKSYDFEKGVKFFKLSNPSNNTKKELLSKVSKSKTNNAPLGKLMSWKPANKR